MFAPNLLVRTFQQLVHRSKRHLGDCVHVRNGPGEHDRARGGKGLQLLRATRIPPEFVGLLFESRRVIFCVMLHLFVCPALFLFWFCVRMRMFLRVCVVVCVSF